MPWITTIHPTSLPPSSDWQTAAVIHSNRIPPPLRYKSSSICKRVTLGLQLKAKRDFIDTFPKYPLSYVFLFSPSSASSFFLSVRSVADRLLLNLTIAHATDVVLRRKRHTHCTPLFAKDSFWGCRNWACVINYISSFFVSVITNPFGVRVNGIFSSQIVPS